MKAVCVFVLVLGLFSASSAQSFDDLVEAGKTVVNKVKDDLVDAAKSWLTDLLAKTLVGKRELGSVGDWFKQVGGKLQELAEKGKDLATTVFTQAVDKLKKLTETYHAAVGAIKDASVIRDHIDSVVAEHHSRQKRVIKELVQTGKDLLAGAYDKAKGVLAKVKEHASNLVSGALQKAVDVFGKRDLSDHLKTIGDALSSAVSPFKDVVSNLGETLKGHFSNLVDTVKGHANALKTKLDPHISDLKGHGQKLLDHGKNALGALSEVISDILNQTVENAAGSLSGASKTLVDAGKTVVGHFTGDDSDSGSY